MKYDVYQGLFIWPQKKTLNLHLTYFVETAQFENLGELVKIPIFVG